MSARPVSERGSANVALDNGSIAIDGGVVRGVDIGATFQGTVRDQNGNMDMTGTFMPAYGLNRLFGELPIIGAILGNGPRPRPARHHLQAGRAIHQAEPDDQPLVDHRARRVP